MSAETSIFGEELEEAEKPKEVEHKRLSRQSKLILDLLLNGRVTNRQMADISLRYSARIFDLRKAGYDIRIVYEDARTGLNIYALFLGGKENQA